MQRSRRLRALALLLISFLVACHPKVNTPVNPIQSMTLRQVAEAHHIVIGAAVRSTYLQEPDYVTVLAAEFSQLQAENEMKFAVIHPAAERYDFTGADALVAFAHSHNMLVRGHTLLWHRQLPQWISSQHYTAEQLADILHQHVKTVMRRYSGKVYAWDVVNEAFNDDGTMRSTVWYDQPGITFAGMGTMYIEQALRWARAADANAKLFYNDYDAEPVNAKSDAIYAMARDFKSRGVPLDGIGFQLHIDLAFDNPRTLASVAANLERFANLGLELHFTELDVRLKDSTAESLNSQAKLYAEIARLCIQQPACKVFQTWGFTDKYSWIPSFYPGQGWALLWDAKYQKKPAYYGVMGLLK